jgi:hypothetical protein
VLEPAQLADEVAAAAREALAAYETDATNPDVLDRFES